MQKQKLILPIAIILVITFVMTLVSAASISNITGIVEDFNYTTANIVCSTTNDSDDCLNCRNATIWYNATGGDVVDIAEAVVLCHIQETAGASNTTIFESTDNPDCATAFEALDDLLTYNFTCTFSNDTDGNTVNATLGGGKLGAVSAVGVDNTDPTVTLTTDYSTINLGRYFKYTVVLADVTADLADATGASTYCNITDAEGDVDKDGVISTTASSEEFQNTHTAGDYVISCTATDTAGNTASDTITVTAKTGGSPIEFDDGATTGLGGLDNTTIIIIIIVIVLIAMAMNKKK